jgi:hypothetical protein
MQRIVSAVVLAGTIGALPRSAPVKEAESWNECAHEAIQSCNPALRGDAPERVALRGWCYAVRTGRCEGLH